MEGSACPRRVPGLPRTHEGPLSTLRVLRCSPPLADAPLGARNYLRLLAAVRLLDLHDPVPRLCPAVRADAVIRTGYRVCLLGLRTSRAEGQGSEDSGVRPRTYYLIRVAASAGEPTCDAPRAGAGWGALRGGCDLPSHPRRE